MKLNIFILVSESLILQSIVCWLPYSIRNRFFACVGIKKEVERIFLFSP